MRKFYQTVILTGVTSVVIAGAAFAADTAKETNLNKVYDKVVAANTAVQAKNEDQAIKSLKSAKWSLRKNDLMNKNKDEVAKDKATIDQINAVIDTLKGKDADKFSKASNDVQKIQDSVQVEMKEYPAVMSPASSPAPAKASEAPKAN
jgi:hypothetical protein